MFILVVDIARADDGQQRQEAEQRAERPAVVASPQASPSRVEDAADPTRSGYLHPVALGIYTVAGLALLAGYLQWHVAVSNRDRLYFEQVLSNWAAEVRRQNRQLEAYNRELIHTNRRLRDAVEEKSRLLGVAVHDLKNPLFGVRALSEIVLETEPLSDRARRKLDLIRQSAQETLELINDLMDSAAEVTDGRIHHAPVDMSALAQRVVKSFCPQAERKEQSLRCSVPNVPCVVDGDQPKLRGAMNNLVSNALKYAPPGTAVDVTVAQNGDQVRIAVTDQGPGLSMHDQKRLFEPFLRLGPEPTGDEMSSGLGLYIVKQITDLHGGDVEVDTTLGEGSTFTLTLPALDAETRSVGRGAGEERTEHAAEA
ncbi:MAG: HAMP domain-containing sensor histidine kinase [Salinibacter sp.]